ncbi:MAG: DUF5081 family protein [Carnobacterium maltaromaticum]
MQTEEKIINENSFSVSELFLLAEACGTSSVFGLPDKKVQLLLNSTMMQDAGETLQEKGILSEETLTEGGYYVLSALNSYINSSQYTRINNCMVGFLPDNQENLVLLVEVEANKKYQLKIIDKLVLLKNLFDESPLLQREPLEDETEFILKKMRNSQRRIAEKLELKTNLLNIEIFKGELYEEEVDSAEYHEQWLMYQDQGELYAVDFNEPKYYRASQYWLMKFVFDSLAIPYGAAASEQQVAE